MRCKILHESRGRMRVQLMIKRLSGEDADRLEFFFAGLPSVREVKVDERTRCAVFFYNKGMREALMSALAEADLPEILRTAPAPEHTGRELSRKYQEKMVFRVLRRGVSRFLLPMPLRTALIVIRSVPYLLRAGQSLARGKLEVSVLDAASITVSMIRGEFDTAGSVMFLLSIGDLMEEWTHRKSVQDLAGVMALNVEQVWLRTPDGQEVLTDIRKIGEGDVILVRSGNMIPLDGTVISGEGMVNQASMTGESLPVHKRTESTVYAGTAMEEGELAVRVRHTSGSGRYDRIVRMIEESEKMKSEAEDKASHLADRLVPWTFGATLLTWALTRNAARAASILMVDFCCALKLSMPIAVLSAMREAGQHHISVKGGKFMENFSEAQTIVFDKTGTLTNACPRVNRVIPFGDMPEDEMLRLAACLEEHYPHSIANAVVAEAKRRGLEHEEKHSRVEYIVAHGIASRLDGKKACIGSYHFIFEDEGAVIPEGGQEVFDALPDEYSHLYLAIDGVLAAVILIEDPLKPEAKRAVKALRDLGFSRIVMMTGDSVRTARAVAALVGVDDYQAEVLPEEKAAFIRAEHEAGRKVIMVGDGINDSPALSEADCGIAINSGAAIAREIADITISEDDLRALVIMKRISDGLMDRIHGNYQKILSFNSFLILMGVLGIFPSTTTALLHNLSTILISLNSMTDLVSDASAR
ncbi:MAG: heavy metal translocating P-type ATPase [Lachnospiraceae bacterium]|nr:heavy metal translocating P-type ATPase [Lachnospiraceae bacterium]